MTKSLGKAPGFELSPGHTITIRPAESPWRATHGGTLLAESSRALILKEAGYAPVVYFPREDVRLEALVAVDRTSTCPFKGEAGYYARSGSEPIAWTYPETYDEVAAIAGHIAFYPQQVEIRPIE